MSEETKIAARYAARLFGPGLPEEGQEFEEFAASSDDAAIRHISAEYRAIQVPDDGGDFELVLERLDELPATKARHVEGHDVDVGPFPPGEVRRWQIHHHERPDGSRASDMERHHRAGLLDELVAQGIISREAADGKFAQGHTRAFAPSKPFARTDVHRLESRSRLLEELMAEGHIQFGVGVDGDDEEDAPDDETLVEVDAS